VSVFTDAEIEYLDSQRLGRMATVGADGQPHIIPVTFVYNAAEDALDIGGLRFGTGKKWRDAQQNPRVTFLVDDSTGRSARAIEVRASAELHETGGETINPRFPQFAPQFFRLRPHRVVSWGLEGSGYQVNARSV
jgi:pyridoxamine 5'-phosphate oxidase family protein